MQMNALQAFTPLITKPGKKTTAGVIDSALGKAGRYEFEDNYGSNTSPGKKDEKKQLAIQLDIYIREYMRSNKNVNVALIMANRMGILVNDV